ncbi:efflux RND transporter permease subunit [candidate division KSB1 bacterium]|nr:efflux RND transporter permease subunit [candidate division KSB1 bacterium]
MKIVKFSITRPVTITMFMVAAIVFGYVAFDRLPINLLPDISYPTLTIRTEYAGTAPGEVENLISKPVEEAVGIISGVIRTSSISRPGMSDVVLEFDWGTDMDFASLEVREKLDMLTLPVNAEPPLLLRFDPSLDPIMRIGLAGDESLIALRLFAEERIKQELEPLDGVASVQISGGLEEEIQINVDEGKLAALSIPVTQVTQRMAQENVNLTGGMLKDGDSEFLVRTLNEFKTVDEMNDIVIGMRDQAPILLKDVADVRKGHKERNIITHLNGKESVEIAVYKEADKNTVTVAKTVKEQLASVMKEFEDYNVPLHMTIVNDQSLFIQNSVDEVLSTAVWGGILAILVLYLFLRNMKSTIIIGFTIPISIVVTFFFMYIANVSLNIMSLGGLALGVGMLVDNSIVVLESIDRYRKQKMSQAEAADKGTSEVAKAVIASTLTTVCVFVPIIFVEGIAGQLFNDQALAVTFSLMASLMVALTLIPMLISRQLSVGEATAASTSTRKVGKVKALWNKIAVQAPASFLRIIRQGFAFISRLLNRLLQPIYTIFDRGLFWLTDSYPNFLDTVLKHRIKVLGGTLLLFVLSLASFPFIGSELIPEMSQGEFFVDVLLPIGTPLEQTEVVIEKMAAVAQQVPGVQSVYAVSGTAAQMGFSATELRENLGQLHIQLANRDDRDMEQRVMDDLRARLASIPAIEYKISRPTLFSFRTPVEVEVRGYNLEELERLSLELAQEMRQVPGLRDVKASTEGGNPEVQIVFNRRRVAQLGLDIASIGAVVRNKVMGEVSTELNRQDRKVDIRVRAQESDRNNIDDLKRLVVNSSGPIPIQLATVADVRLERGPSEIRRIDQERVALVTANLTGRDLGSVSVDIQNIINALQLPPDFRVRIGGQQREMATSFDSMKLAIALAIFLVYLVMASQFESLVQPFIIMFTIPFALIGVILTLLITRTPVSVVVLIGVIMLAGIVVNNAIVLLDYINQLRKSGLSKREAIKQGGQVRLRPILMTTITTVLGLLPMALGLGEGAELRTPMAVTVIGGLMIGTLLTLVVIPTVYDTVVREKIVRLDD